MEEQLSRCSTSFSQCGQVDGIRRPLFEVVPSTAMKHNRDGRRDECASDDDLTEYCQCTSKLAT